MRLYKPVDRRFKDFIAIPKANGYQSLHTVLLGPFGAPIEVQIRTAEMDSVAERGVAAHWAYKTDCGPANSAQARAREWLSSLADSQANTASSSEFIENVKIDLFPDEVYLFTPRGDILSLPRNATALDFAYAVHTDVGDHAVAARVDKKLLPLRTRLESGQLVEIITAPSAVPNPAWLEVGRHRQGAHGDPPVPEASAARGCGRLRSSHARSRARCAGQQPGCAFRRRCWIVSWRRPSSSVWKNCCPISRWAIACRDLVASQLRGCARQEDRRDRAGSRRMRAEKIRITGAERGVLSFANCCHPLPGDDIIGYLSSGKGIVVHREECPNVVELRKSPERCVAIEWDRDVQGDYRAELRIEVINRPGVLATVAAAIAAADSNIENVEYVERDAAAATLLFAMEVKNRKHLAEVIRRVRRTGVVSGAYRYPL